MLVAWLWTFQGRAEAIIIRDDVDDSEYVQDAGAFPAVFQLFERKGGVATLVAPRWAVTAAHVARDVQTGHTVTISGVEYQVTHVVLHPEWETVRMDIGLVQLDRPVEGVEIIPPYTEGDEAGRVVTLVGQGDTGNGLTGPVSSDGLLRAATNLVERVEGKMLVFGFDSPSDPNVTRLEGISGPGDSGGPALIKTTDGFRVAGVSVAQMSAGHGKGTYGVVEFYTRLSLNLGFVADTTGLPIAPAVPVKTGEENPDISSEPPRGVVIRTVEGPVETATEEPDAERATDATDVTDGNGNDGLVVVYAGSAGGGAIVLVVALKLWRRRRVQAP